MEKENFESVAPGEICLLGVTRGEDGTLVTRIVTAAELRGLLESNSRAEDDGADSHA